MKAGVNFSTLSQKGADLSSLSWESYTGFTVGGFYTVGINDYLAFQPELYYSRKGGKLEGSIAGFLGSKSIDIDYLEIPLLLKLRISHPVQNQPRRIYRSLQSVSAHYRGQDQYSGV